MKQRVTEVIEKINFKLKLAKENFKEWNTYHELRMAEIGGILTVLELLTGKKYTIDFNNSVVKEI